MVFEIALELREIALELRKIADELRPLISQDSAANGVQTEKSTNYVRICSES